MIYKIAYLMEGELDANLKPEMEEGLREHGGIEAVVDVFRYPSEAIGANWDGPLCETPYDLIVSGIIMSTEGTAITVDDVQEMRKTGLHIRRKLREYPEGPNYETPFLYVSVVRNEAILQEMRAEGRENDGFVQYPCYMDELAPKIAEMLSSGGRTSRDRVS